MERMGVGIVGCGKISGIYLRNLTRVFDNVTVKAAADLDIERARAVAAEYPGVEAVSVEDLLRRDDVGIVLNLTVPKAHYSVAIEAINAGKNVYNEKPLTLSRDEAKSLLAAARARRLRVGCAPDTFMGAGIQTCRKLIDNGAIGEPVAATAFMLCHGHEGWHPDPEFYYEKGGGPMFDMGPYYLTALVALIGRVQSVTGYTRITFPERTIGSEKKRGQIIPVDVPTHVAGTMQFDNGAIGTLITSFDVWDHQLPRIEIYGSEGSLSVPDPNTFGGPVKLLSRTDRQWKDVPLTHGYAENSRGIGVADMASAIRSKPKRDHRASGALAAHVLDVMHAFHDASDRGRRITVRSRCERPSAVPTGLAAGAVD